MTREEKKFMLATRASDEEYYVKSAEAWKVFLSGAESTAIRMFQIAAKHHAGRRDLIN